MPAVVLERVVPVQLYLVLNRDPRKFSNTCTCSTITGAAVRVERAVASLRSRVSGLIANLREVRPVVAGEVALIPQHSADVLLLRDTRNLLKQPDLLRATLNHRY